MPVEILVPLGFLFLGAAIARANLFLGLIVLLAGGVVVFLVVGSPIYMLAYVLNLDSQDNGDWGAAAVFWLVSLIVVAPASYGLGALVRGGSRKVSIARYAAFVFLRLVVILPFLILVHGGQGGLNCGRGRHPQSVNATESTSSYYVCAPNRPGGLGPLLGE